MKTSINIAWMAIILLVAGCAAGKSLEKEGIAAIATGKIEPGQLVEKDGKVAFKYAMTLPPKSVGRVQTLKMTPIVVYGDQRIPLSSFYVQGQGVKHTPFPVVAYRKPFEISRRYKMDWKPGFENARIYLQTELSRCGKIKGASEVLIYSAGIQKSPSTVSPTVRKADLTGEIRGIVMFQVSDNQIISGRDYMKYLRTDLEKVMAYPGAEITSIELLVSCSPEGTTVFNTRLGENRYRVAHHYFGEQLALNRYATWTKALTQQIVAENWQGLYDLLEDSKIPDREQLIIRLKALLDHQREQLLVRDMNRYPIIKQQYLPSLRNAQIIIKYKMPWHEIKPMQLPGVW
ncbi:MAG: hypothetical protein RR397_05220 [Odoribacter sp.]